MKTSFILFLIAASLMISCSKPATTVDPVQKGISYPDSIYFGRNILNLQDSTVLTDSYLYSLSAVLEKDANLSLVISNITNIDSLKGLPIWAYLPSQNIGWFAMEYNYSNDTQKFFSVQSGKIDLTFTVFLTNGMHGKCKIDFYENSTIITRTKYLKW